VTFVVAIYTTRFACLATDFAVSNYRFTTDPTAAPTIEPAPPLKPGTGRETKLCALPMAWFGCAGEIVTCRALMTELRRLAVLDDQGLADATTRAARIAATSQAAMFAPHVAKHMRGRASGCVIRPASDGFRGDMLYILKEEVVRCSGHATYCGPMGMPSDEVERVAPAHLQGISRVRRWPAVLGRLRPLFAEVAARAPGVVTPTFELGVLFRDARGKIRSHHEVVA